MQNLRRCAKTERATTSYQGLLHVISHLGQPGHKLKTLRATKSAGRRGNGFHNRLAPILLLLTIMTRYRGSRKHVLDWTNREEVFGELVDMLRPCPISIPFDAPLMPRGYGAPTEARLQSFGPKWIANRTLWRDLQNWWPGQFARGNTPNWDIALGCLLAAKKGLILIEAKANWPELGTGGRVASVANVVVFHRRQAKRTTNALIVRFRLHEKVGRRLTETVDDLTSHALSTSQ